MDILPVSRLGALDQCDDFSDGWSVLFTHQPLVAGLDDVCLCKWRKQAYPIADHHFLFLVALAIAPVVEHAADVPENPLALGRLLARLQRHQGLLDRNALACLQLARGPHLTAEAVNAPGLSQCGRYRNGTRNVRQLRGIRRPSYCLCHCHFPV